MGVGYAWERFLLAVETLADGGKCYRDRLRYALEALHPLRDFEDLPPGALREDWRSIFQELDAFLVGGEDRKRLVGKVGGVRLWVSQGMTRTRRRELGQKIVRTFSDVAIAYGAESR